MTRLFRLTVGLFVFLGLGAISATSAGAQSTSGLLSNGISNQAASMLEALRSRHKSQAAPSATDTPPPEISDREQTVIGFPKRFTYSADITSAYAGGNTGFENDSLRGGVDATLTYRVEPRTNVFVDYYQLQVQILGVDTGVVPLYIAAPNSTTGTPVGTFSLSNIPTTGSIKRADVTTTEQAFVVGIQRLGFIGGSPVNKGHAVVFTVAYDAEKGEIGPGGAGNEPVTNSYLSEQLQFREGQGFKQIVQRDVQHFTASFTVPFSLTPKVLALYTATAWFQAKPSGFNKYLARGPQFEQMGFIQYNPNPRTAIYVNPSKSITYFPTDTYPVSTGNFVAGITRQIAGGPIPLYIGGQMITSNPDNSDGLGVTRETIFCPGYPTTISQQCLSNIGTGRASPSVGGNKFTTFQIILGTGTTPMPVPYP
jgi:hypothetical protein